MNVTVRCYFHYPQDIDWTRFAIVIGAVMVFWGGMAEILPERWHHAIEVMLAAINGAIIFFMRSGKLRDPGSRTRMTDSEIERPNKK